MFGKGRAIKKFNTNYLQLKVMQYKNMKEFRPLIEKVVGKMADEDYGRFCALAVDYLLGEEIESRYRDGSGAKFDESIPAKAEKLHAITGIKAFVIAVLEYKNEQLTKLLEDDWTNSSESSRVHDSLVRLDYTDSEDLETEYMSFKQMLAAL